MNNIESIRTSLRSKLHNDDFCTDKTGVKTIEIIGAQFIADEPVIYGIVNDEWNTRELNWYKLQSRNVYDIHPPVPKIWEQVSSDNGTINSNYGWCIWSKENHEQYNNVLTELVSNKFTRRAQMIYTRPTMHRDYNIDGMSDFICTTAVQYFIRDDKLISYVTMRSNDAIFGYKGDYHWQKYVLDKLSSDLGICSGDIIWNVGSFHVYERHFNLIT